MPITNVRDIADQPLVGPPAAHIQEAELGAEISLYDPQTERVLILNQTASDVWRLSDGTHRIQEIVDLLAQAYGVDPMAIETEVAAAVDALVEQGFLRGPTEP